MKKVEKLQRGTMTLADGRRGYDAQVLAVDPRRSVLTVGSAAPTAPLRYWLSADGTRVCVERDSAEGELVVGFRLVEYLP